MRASSPETLAYGSSIYDHPIPVTPRTLAIAEGLSDVAAVIGGIDRIGRAIPWYVWVAATAYVTYRLCRAAR